MLYSEGLGQTTTGTMRDGFRIQGTVPVWLALDEPGSITVPDIDDMLNHAASRRLDANAGRHGIDADRMTLEHILNAAPALSSATARRNDSRIFWLSAGIIVIALLAVAAICILL